MKRLVLFLFLPAAAVSAQTASTPTPAAPADLVQRFHLADRNRDEALSRDEAAQAGWFGRQLERFESLDTDHSGTVTLTEIGAGIAAQVDRWMSADTDRDGRISADEAKRAPQAVGEVFGQVDDGKGAVTREQLESFSQRSYYDQGDLPSVAPNIIERRF